MESKIRMCFFGSRGDFCEFAFLVRVSLKRRDDGPAAGLCCCKGETKAKQSRGVSTEQQESPRAVANAIWLATNDFGLAGTLFSLFLRAFQTKPNQAILRNGGGERTRQTNRIYYPFGLRSSARRPLEHAEGRRRRRRLRPRCRCARRVVDLLLSVFVENSSVAK